MEGESVLRLKGEEGKYVRIRRTELTCFRVVQNRCALFGDKMTIWSMRSVTVFTCNGSNVNVSSYLLFIQAT